ncbi:MULTISPECIES: hypothetical protein [Flavobacteriaceae]|uniref:Uncharacterized protein n=2 Tax=Flavobacteriaceae TaxID=49546 RepID=A0A5D0G4Z9_9FLAO|nr:MULTISPECIES: hypothetical protein [Flavobacteriaceae]PWK18924.1 hypothetical protein LX78_01398 [Xanthomarina spongicola]TYA52967.1 hypothetical protein FVF61_09890 [Formosa maritima]
MSNIVHIIFFTLVIIYSGNAQNEEMLYSNKKDTLFISYPKQLKDSLVKITYDSVKIKNNLNTIEKTVGLKTTYNLLDSANLKLRKEYLLRKEYNRINGILSSNSMGKIVGLYFVHTQRVDTSYLRDQNSRLIYYKNIFLKHLKSDVSFDIDKKLYYIYRTNESATRNYIISFNELQNKKRFYFDGTENKYKELQEIIKTPMYIYIYDKSVINSENEEVLLFKEVIWKHIQGTL